MRGYGYKHIPAAKEMLKDMQVIRHMNFLVKFAYVFLRIRTYDLKPDATLISKDGLHYEPPKIQFLVDVGKMVCL